MEKRGYWKTRLGFYLAAIGSAVGLGNLWRFPYILSENGGGAFVVLYLLFALTVGLPLLVGELILGRTFRQGVVLSTESLQPIPIFGTRRWLSLKWVGRLSFLLSVVVLSYYAVISGWVLHFMTQFFFALFSPMTTSFDPSLDPLLTSGWMQMLLASVHILVTLVVVLKGVQDGIERWVGAMMPVFAVLLVSLVIKSLSLPSSGEALRFLFYPNFSQLSLSSFSHAIGHVLFTLSVGFGTMVTFGSYLKDSDAIASSGFRVTIVDTFLSLTAGLLIFPIALGAGSVELGATRTDPGLLFETLPRFLMSLPGGAFFGLAFFVCLYLSALGASLGLMEVIVSNALDWSKKKKWKVQRMEVVWTLGGLILLLSAIPAFSSVIFRASKNSKGFLEWLDAILINGCLPLVGLGLSLAISHGLSEMEKKRQFIDENKIETQALFPYWRWALKYFVPLVIIISLILQILNSI